jgi:hypothetical protein
MRMRKARVKAKTSDVHDISTGSTIILLDSESPKERLPLSTMS